MKIAIIGAGNVGSTLGNGWSKSGHEVVYGVRDKTDQKYKSLTEYAEVKNSLEAAKEAYVIVIATPWPQTQAAVQSLGGAVDNKILIDCTNPLEPELSGLTVGHIQSGAELIAQWAPSARVVKAFNTTGFNNMAQPEIQNIKTVMFVASDDSEASKTTVQLAEELGFDAVEFGGLDSARLLEPFALVWISLAYRFGMGRDFGFAILRN